MHQHPSSTYQYFVALSAAKSDPDTLSFKEALSGDHTAEFNEAMTKEVDALQKRNIWTLLPKFKLPESVKVIPATWAMKIKGFPSGSFRSLKARFCDREDLQKKAVNDIDTYSPVVQWATVCLMLLISIMLQLKTCSADFSNAFAHADMKGEPVYISPPPIMSCFPRDKVLKLNKSLYGQADAPRIWYDKLRASLETRGFTTCKADPCLFTFKKVVCIIYVDDCLLFARDSKDIDAVLKSFKEDGD
eukprot:12710601-Ditylum_brightwellii.AAC.1